jgi:L-glutamate---[L-glutamyl-carrier protein] ligase
MFGINPDETRWLFDEIFARRIYVRHGVQLVDGATVIDVGANIGMFTVFCHREACDVTVHAIEPAPEVVAVLRSNIAQHGVRAVVHEVACGREDGSGEFTFYPRATTHSGLRAELGRHANGEGPGAGEHLRVPVRTLSSLIDVRSIEHVDLLKIDAEWAEESILRGIAERHWRRIDQVVVEVHGGSGAIDAYLTERNLIVAREYDAATGHAIVYARRNDGAQQGTSVRA